jgi:hypothetical protein
MNADIVNFKKDLASGRDSGIVQVFQNLVLRVNRDAFSTREVLKINSVTATSEAQLDPMVDQALSFHPLTNTHFYE